MNIHYKSADPRINVKFEIKKPLNMPEFSYKITYHLLNKKREVFDTTNAEG